MIFLIERHVVHCCLVRCYLFYERVNASPNNLLYFLLRIVVLSLNVASLSELSVSDNP